MKAIKYLEEQKFGYDHFTKLTSTGINPDNINIAQFAEDYHQAKLNLLNIPFVSSMLPSISSSTFKNYLEAKGYAETLNPLVYNKQDFEYDKEVLHRHFLNEIEFGN